MARTDRRPRRRRGRGPSGGLVRISACGLAAAFASGAFDKHRACGPHGNPWTRARNASVPVDATGYARVLCVAEPTARSRLRDRAAARVEISADEKYSSSLLKTNRAHVSIKPSVRCGSRKLFVRACACNGENRSLVFDAHERCAIGKSRRLRASNNPHDGRRMKRKFDVRDGGASARSEPPACAGTAPHRNRPHSRSATVQAARVSPAGASAAASRAIARAAPRRNARPLRLSSKEPAGQVLPLSIPQPIGSASNWGSIQ
jgi:hypothetical protein